MLMGDRLFHSTIDTASDESKGVPRTRYKFSTHHLHRGDLNLDALISKISRQVRGGGGG
jgi:hypothetical protein